MQALSHSCQKSHWGADLVSKKNLIHRMGPKLDPKQSDTTSFDHSEDIVVWDKPGGISRIFFNWTWCWSFCYVPVSKSYDTASGKAQSEVNHVTTIDHILVIQQPPPLMIETEWSSDYGHPKVVYICNPPVGHLQLIDRVASIDSITLSGDEASQDCDDEVYLLPPPPIQRMAPPRPPRNSASGPPKPLPIKSRGDTYGSTTTQSSRHRRSLRTVSPTSLRQVHDTVDCSSQDSPIPELSGTAGSSSGDSLMMDSPPAHSHHEDHPLPKLMDATELSLFKSEKWMEAWTGGGQTEEPIQETRDDISLENQVCSEQVESTYLPRCAWLEHAFLSAGSKILFAGWVVYCPNDIPVRNFPLRQDIVYVMLLEDIPKIYLARDKDQDMSTLDVTPKMRAEIKDISKSHGRGVVLRQDGAVHGTLVPISLPSFMFHNHSLVENDEFEELAYRTIAPFRRDSYSNYTQWCHTEYHQEYAPVAQLEAAMHLMFVIDSWMTKMLKR